MNKQIKFFLKAIVSGAFLGWILVTTNWSEVWFYIKEVEIWHLIIYLVILFLGFTISSYKWKLLADSKEIHYPYREIFQLYFIGTFINNFMPSFIAGDAYKAMAIGNRDKKLTQAASTVMMDRITGFVGATVLLFLFNLVNFHTMIQHKLLLIANFIILASFIIDFILYLSRRSSGLKRILRKIMPSKIIEFFWELGYYNKKAIMQSILLGIIFSFIGVAMLNYVLFQTLGIEIGMLNYLSVIFLIAIISSIPVSVNNIGIKEWAYVTFFGLFGLNASAVLTVAIISRTIQMVVSFAALPMYLRRK